MTLILKVADKFAAAHHLPNYDGDCERIHGHTWKIIVGFKLETTSGIKATTVKNSGIAVDFKLLKALVGLMLPDHQYINKYFKTDFPTAEWLACDLKRMYDTFFDVYPKYKKRASKELNMAIALVFKAFEPFFVSNINLNLETDLDIDSILRSIDHPVIEIVDFMDIMSDDYPDENMDKIQCEFVELYESDNASVIVS